MGTIIGMGAVVDACRLGISIPRFDFGPTGRHRCFVARPVATHQINGRAGAITGYQITAIAGVFGRRQDRPRHPQPLPPKPHKHGLEHGDDFVRYEQSQQFVEFLKIGRLKLIDMPIHQIGKPYCKPFVGTTVSRTTGIHIGLHRHQQHRIKSFGLTIGGIPCHLCGGSAPRQGPRRIGAQ